MINCPLKEELDIIQREYLGILKQVSRKEEEIPQHLVDAINIFWFEKKNIIKLVCDYYFNEADTYCITGESYFDISDKDEYGFFMLGGYHVFDDPLPDYLLATSKVSDQVFLKKLQSIIAKTIKQNIKLIEEYEGMFYVLPLRHISQLFRQDDDELNELADYLIFQFFSDIRDKETYQKTVSTIDDVIEHLDPNNSSGILLSDDDNPSVDWKMRFHIFLENYCDFDPSNYSEGKIFYMTLYGYIRQALEIIAIEDIFSVIPFLKSFVPLHYYTMLTKTLESNKSEEVDPYKHNYIKSQLAYLVYTEYRKRNFDNSISQLRIKSDGIDFERRLLEIKEIDSDLGEIGEIVQAINDLLGELESQ